MSPIGTFKIISPLLGNPVFELLLYFELGRRSYNKIKLTSPIVFDKLT